MLFALEIDLQDYQILIQRMRSQNTYKTRQKSRLKASTRPAQSGGMLDSLKGVFTNISYSFHKIKMPFMTKTPSQPVDIYVSGHYFKSVQECIHYHENLIWFTYRKNCKINLTIRSDVGWGCMIRSAQMMMAEALRSYFREIGFREDPSYIVNAFLETQLYPKYTINRFVDAASSLFLKKPGAWFSITEAAFILKQLHQHSPLKGSEHLKIVVCNEAFDPKKIKDILIPEDLNSQSFSKHLPPNTNNSIFSKKNGILTQSRYQRKVKNAALLIITTKLGEDEVREDAYWMLLELMRLSCFSGCLGGIPNKARYLTGRYGDQISYLDPHYVQTEVDKMNLKKEIEKFHCKQYLLMTRQDMDTDIAICFLIKDIYDLQKLIDTLEMFHKKHRWRLIQMRAEEQNNCMDVEEDQISQLDDCDNRSSISNSMESSFLMD